MFCPNCGAQNPDTATTCQKCGFAIRGGAGPKFKGTMLMMNSPAGFGGPSANPPAQPPPGAAPHGTPAHGTPAPAAPFGGTVVGVGPTPAPGAVAPGAAQPAARARLKGTMIGVAPPSPGAAAPPAAPAAAPPQAAAPAGNPYGALAPTAAMPAVSAPPTAAMAAYDPQPSPGPAAHPSVNPLGGTMVAPAAAQAGYPGNFAAQAPSADIPVDMRDSAYGASPLSAAPAGAPAAPAYGGGYPAQPASAGWQQEGVPQTQPGSSQLQGAGGFATFTVRSPLLVAVLAVVTLGIYGVLWFAWTADELRNQGQELPPSWHLIVPILNLIWIWRWCEALDNTSQGEHGAATSFLLVFFLGPIGMAILQSKLNQL